MRQITDMLGAILLPKLSKTNRACLQALKKGQLSVVKMDGMPYKLF